MELKLKKVDNKFCNVILPDKETYYIITNFMLGDADGYETINQLSFKSLNEPIKNFILKLYDFVDTYTEDISTEELYFGFELDLPYFEASYYSFTHFDIVYLDSNRNIIPCEIILDKNEECIIKSLKD